jgi:hypothetical protein
MILIPSDPMQVQYVRTFFLERLGVPHQTIESSFTDYSSFETEFDPSNWMKHLKGANTLVAVTKDQITKLSVFEYQQVIQTIQLYIILKRFN